MATLTKKKAAAKKVAVVVKKKTSNKVVPKKETSIFTFDANENEVDFYKRGEHIGDWSLADMRGLNCSCGTIEGNGVSELETFFFDEKVPQHVVIAAVKAYITAVKVSKKKAHIVVSNNEDSPFTNRVLDKICSGKSDWKLNPNTRNNIRVWIL